MTTFYDLPAVGAEVSLHCHQVVREDAHHLYGFIRQRDRDIFRTLLKVNGVGAKLGLAILSGMDAAGFSRAIFEGDTASLSRLPGIGKKTAERLVVELRDRLEATSTPLTANGAASGPVDNQTAVPLQDPAAEAVNALIALGLKPPEASRRVHAVHQDGQSCEEIVRSALQAMVR